MKYKLIKEYPGSPELGTIHCSENNIMSWKGTDFYESYPEYWEKVNENLWYVVSNRDYQEGNMLFQEWFIYSIETCFPKDNGVLLYFKTKEEADEFILFNKPCLSHSDIMWNFKENTKKNNVSIDIEELIALIKSKI